MRIGKAKNQGKPSCTIAVDIDGKTIMAKAGNEINSGKVLVADGIAFSATSPHTKASLSNIKRKRPKKKKAASTYPIKLLAVIENEETEEYEFWVYGDSKKPQLIYQVDYNNNYLASAKIINEGKGWQVFIKLEGFGTVQYHPSFWENLTETTDTDSVYQAIFIDSANPDTPIIYSEQDGNYRNTSLLESVGNVATIDPYTWFDAWVGIKDIDFYTSFISPATPDLTSLTTIFRAPDSLHKSKKQAVASQWFPTGFQTYPQLKTLIDGVYQNVGRNLTVYSPKEFETITSYSQIFSNTIPKAPTPFLETFEFSTYTHELVYGRCDSFGNGNLEEAIAVSSPGSFALTANSYLYLITGYNQTVPVHSPTLALTSASTTTSFSGYVSYPQYNFTYSYTSFSVYKRYEDSGKQYLSEVGFLGTTYNIELEGNYDPNPYNVYKFIPHELTVSDTLFGGIQPWRQLLLTVAETVYFDKTETPMRSLPEGFTASSLQFEFYTYPRNRQTYHFNIHLSTGKGGILIHSPLVSLDNYHDNSVGSYFSYSTVDLGSNQRKDKVIRVGSEDLTVSFFNSTYPFKLNVLTQFSTQDHVFLDASIPFLFLEGDSSYIVGVFEGKTYGEVPLTYDYTTRYYLHYKNSDEVIEITDYSEIQGTRSLYYDDNFQQQTYTYINLPIPFCSLIGNKIHVIDTEDPTLNQSLEKEVKTAVKIYAINEGSISLSEKKYPVLPLKKEAEIWSASFF